MSSLPILRTERLILRAPRTADAPDIFRAYAQDREVCRYLIWAPHQSVAETREFIRQCIEESSAGSRFPWVITSRTNDELLGMIELRVHGFKADVGYVLARPFWGNGIVTEALSAVMAFAFSMPNIYRVWALCDVANTASARVMEKAGMVREGILRRYAIHPNNSPEPCDVYCYAKTR